MQKTSNYNLNQWDASDRVLMADFNADNAAIDAALTGKVDAEELAALAESVGAGGQNCRIETGSYVGDGTYGFREWKTLEFSIRPEVIFFATAAGSQYAPTIMIRGSTHTNAETGYGVTEIEWSEQSIKWYGNYDAIGQLNSSGTTYYYVALGTAVEE